MNFDQILVERNRREQAIRDSVTMTSMSRVTMSVRLMWSHRRSGDPPAPPLTGYSYYSSLNAETLLLGLCAPMEAMQFGRALERYICHIVHAGPRFEAVKMIKVDLAEGSYRI